MTKKKKCQEFTPRSESGVSFLNKWEKVTKYIEINKKGRCVNIGLSR